MNTKDKIVNAAIRLFNKHGVTNASIRMIASEVNISHSNLAYHYRSKNELLHEVYSRMDKEMSDAVFPPGDHSLEHYHNLLNRISDFQRKHRFFYMDLLAIAREYPEIIDRYRITVAKRSEEYDELIKHFIKRGLVKKEGENGFYRSLFHSIWVMSTFWLQQEQILGKSNPLISSGSDTKHVWEIILPHLTHDGLKEYRSFMNVSSSEVRPIEKLYLDQIK